MAKTMSTIRRYPNQVEIGIRMSGSEYPAPSSYIIGNNVVNGDGTVTYGYIEPIVETPSKVISYAIEVSANFDGSWSSVTTLPLSGSISKSVVNPGNYESQFRGITRWLFNPSDYSITELDNLKPFWLRYTAFRSDGTSVGPSAPHLILPYNSISNRSYSINGTIGTGVVEIALPGLSTSASFSVEGTNLIYVSFEKNGAEYPVAGLGNGMDWTTSFPSFNSLFVRGSASSTKFYMNCRLANSTTI
jgi:hypothetical protein